MENEQLSDDARRQISLIKRTYWMQEGIGKEYHFCAFKPVPVTRAKNLTELRFVLSHARGPRILDAGAGTGRFTIPTLRTGLHCVALDISRDMLREGLRNARKSNATFPATVGEIERLPFPDATFDTVVSITVLRHFPDWEMILDEYLRVLRPNGRVIFDIASGEQRAYLGGYKLANEKGEFDPLGYDAALTIAQLEALAAAKRVSIIDLAPHDFVNENALLDRSLGANYERFYERLPVLLEADDALELFELLWRRFLHVASPACCPTMLVALEKTAATVPFDFTYRSVAAPPDGLGKIEALNRLAKQALGRKFDSYLRELRRQLEHPAAAEFFRFLESDVLSCFPIDAFYWDSRESPDTGAPVRAP